MNPLIVQMHSKLCDVQLELNQTGKRLDDMESTKARLQWLHLCVRVRASVHWQHGEGK
jgi:hypothetical protein